MSPRLMPAEKAEPDERARSRRESKKLKQSGCIIKYHILAATSCLFGAEIGHQVAFKWLKAQLILTRLVVQSRMISVCGHMVTIFLSTRLKIRLFFLHLLVNKNAATVPCGCKFDIFSRFITRTSWHRSTAARNETEQKEEKTNKCVSRRTPSDSIEQML